MTWTTSGFSCDAAVRFIAVALALGSVATAGCMPAGDEDEPGSAQAGPRVAGSVFDEAGAALADVVVSKDGTEVARTDAAGRFSLDAGAGETVVLRFTAPGFVRGMERIELADAATALRVTMRAQAEPIPLDSDAGGRVQGDRGASLDAPPSAFVDRQGNPIAGMVDVHLTPLNPAVPEQLAAYPGDGRARTAGGTTVQLESFGVVDVTVRQGDTDLTIAPGVGVTVEFPLPDPAPASPPASIALWSFDEQAGVWTEEGTATLDAARGVYVGTLGHLSPWNCDQPLEATCVKGHVRDRDGTGIAGAYVVGNGVDYSGDASAVSGAGGEFCLPARKQSVVDVTVYLPGGETLTRRIDSGTDDTDIPVACDDPRCLDTGDWQLDVDAGADDGVGDGGWDGDACFDDSEPAALSMQLHGAIEATLDWDASPWLAACGALAGSTSADSTWLMFQQPEATLAVMLSLEVDPAQTASGVATTVYLLDDWSDTTATDPSTWYLAEACVADVTRNEVLAPGLFALAGHGHCNAPATNVYGGTGTVDVSGEFSFGGIVIGDDVTSEVIYQCCSIYGG
ncbi:MAG: carboxypeptidase-like regulatory domain-containing protein [Nannocystaceae bacterium]|nr:carboxypeptidase-like regulatory domain-containing protein [Nannocystaceae bacterium]